MEDKTNEIDQKIKDLESKYELLSLAGRNGGGQEGSGADLGLI